MVGVARKICTFDSCPMGSLQKLVTGTTCLWEKYLSVVLAQCSVSDAVVFVDEFLGRLEARGVPSLVAFVPAKGCPKCRRVGALTRFASRAGTGLEDGWLSSLSRHVPLMNTTLRPWLIDRCPTCPF